MIFSLRGELIAVREESALLEVQGVTYEVYVPAPVRDLLCERSVGTEVELFTYHYLQSDGNRITPVLLGFQNEAERDFFERLMDVPRIGPLSALRVMVLPVGELARAIEMSDETLLKKLPGVGRQRARDMIASLQGKLARFMEAGAGAGEYVPAVEPRNDMEAGALEVLLQLGVSRQDALRSLRQAVQAHPEATTADELVRLVFQSR